MEYLGLSAKIADYIAGRARDRLEKFDKNAAKKRKDAKSETELPALNLQLPEQRREEELRYLPVNWLTDAARRAGQIQLVTHAQKFTHSDAKGSSLYAPCGQNSSFVLANETLISTASLGSAAIDIVGNAAALDVGKLLQLEDGGKTLIEHIREGDSSPLQPFAESSEQLQSWIKGFQQALESKEFSSHTLSKQLFYPIGDGQYHLLAPLFASSLAQSVHLRIASSRYSEGAKNARDAKKKLRFFESPVLDYPNIAVQHFGGTKPQNISQLNSVRGGKSLLISCSPPRWQSQTRPPLQIKNIIDGPYSYRVRRLIWELKEYLLSQVGKSSTLAVRQQRAERIDQLIDELILLGAEIQTLDYPAGWSASDDCQLPLHQRLWLDPGRAAEDEPFAHARDKKDWIEQVARDFSIWLNRQLEHDKLAFGAVEHREWKHLMGQKLHLLKDDLEGVEL
tara:strand:+ start:5015 stop:6370 length:1356 start_codon:yes stop_codon:yes gene_type:complete